MTSVALALVSRADVEDFLYHEAALLDEWRLGEWLDLFTMDCVYEVPATDRPDEALEESFALIRDLRPMLEQRVIRLRKPTAHAEFPHSRTRRLITNVRIISRTDDELSVAANFVVFRIQRGVEVSYVGRYHYVLAATAEGFKIQRRKATLDHDVLDPHGKISIIL
ncbi:aromatic-ring-hydroxylating dioxygenase subunit beta [Mycobacterium montefiorense]|uniref:Aromatic-ring-hydroxylating dioxygenase subunit beta n=1 Tax=Mycobacterium montefiorense TaxID=154654 RepID=A0AA37PNE8_9MYCO|nr:aromatic-ring-hydroxylating dioxygenase subunit beta [Mycobacterium montefiorense]GBG36995.1 aromatic-ring-hydroxylating dioxygenase subunit beta [Mycobacterium montefiorense]GKU32868.1 aromatic-ring-hydroxylating dioxygenase subunit beta [Mycobacterium montefiorense]GKU42545.1 aromatic-ring-hydroxylating dioxygenase subunit beta [Mycobacterium montefiorense]GKU48298.1 aromatic-ring-hydroxylating dioxygenase subunit beta [Mycobacterium montefiorense]GKU50800.1 aromatic-ring-hydroxylating di